MGMELSFYGREKEPQSCCPEGVSNQDRESWASLREGDKREKWKRSFSGEFGEKPKINS